MPYSGPRGDRDWSYIPNPDPTRHYRWLADDPRRLSLWLRSIGNCPGYELVRRPYAKPVKDIDETNTTWGLAKQLGLDPEGYVDVTNNRIRYQFSVLASIPMEEYERRVSESREEAIQRDASIEDSYMARVEARGVRPFKRELEEIEDRKEFATRPSNNRVSLSQPRRERA